MSFTQLKAGNNITINDTIWNSQYNSGSPALNIGNEDNETERLANGTNTYTGQKWDFEGMFWNTTTKTLTLVAGWDFQTGVKHGGEYIQIGDLFLGAWDSANGNGAAGNGFDPMVAIDFARDGKGGLLASGSYTKITGDFTTKLPTDVVQSSPFEYLSGGSKQDNSLFTYSTGYVTDTPFSGWADSDDNNIFNNEHYYLQISGLEETDLLGKILHITLGCGNDTGRGELPVPEPSTLLLLGGGLLGLAFYSRRRSKA